MNNNAYVTIISILIQNLLMRKIFLCLAAFLCINSVHAAADDVLLKQELNDQSTAKRALEFSIEINTSGRFRGCNPREPLSTPSQMWEMVREEISLSHGRKGTQQIFKLKPGRTPSEGLQDFFKTGGVVECATAHGLVLDRIRLELLGYSKFNELGRGGYSLPNLELSALEVCGKGEPTLPGQFGYITNIEFYTGIHQDGSSMGENVFCVGINSDKKPLYMGFGPFFNEPKTKKQIIAELYRKTIIKPTLDDTFVKPGNSKEKLLSIRLGLWNIYKDRQSWRNNRVEQQKKYPIYRIDSKWIAITSGTRNCVTAPALHSPKHTTFLKKIMAGNFGPNFLFPNGSGQFQVRKG